MECRRHHVSIDPRWVYNVTSITPFSASALHLHAPVCYVAEKMTTQPISDNPATPVVSDSTKPPYCANGAPEVVLVRKPSSGQQQPGDLPEIRSLQIVASDPEAACGIPVQQTVQPFGVEPARDELVGDAATAPYCTPNKDANLPAPTPRYRPAYELADDAHERLGRSSHPPVLKT
jgi:hypothetical protein